MSQKLLLTLIPALFGLVGVLVGGVVTGATAWYRERRQERRDLRNEQLEMKVAARLVLLDINATVSTVEAIIKFQWGPPTLPHVEAWTAHRLPLARDLTRDDWRTVSGAIMVHEMAMTHVEAFRAKFTETPFTMDVSQFEDIKRRLIGAQAVLRRVCDGEG